MFFGAALVLLGAIGSAAGVVGLAVGAAGASFTLSFLSTTPS